MEGIYQQKYTYNYQIKPQNPHIVVLGRHVVNFKIPNRSVYRLGNILYLTLGRRTGVDGVTAPPADKLQDHCPHPPDKIFGRYPYPQDKICAAAHHPLRIFFGKALRRFLGSD
jgi:hypothetical protein